ATVGTSVPRKVGKISGATLVSLVARVAGSPIPVRQPRGIADAAVGTGAGRVWTCRRAGVLGGRVRFRSDRPSFWQSRIRAGSGVGVLGGMRCRELPPRRGGALATGT